MCLASLWKHQANVSYQPLDPPLPPGPYQIYHIILKHCITFVWNCSHAGVVPCGSPWVAHAPEHVGKAIHVGLSPLNNATVPGCRETRRREGDRANMPTGEPPVCVGGHGHNMSMVLPLTCGLRCHDALCRHKPENVRWYPNGMVDSFVYDTCHVRADGEGSFWSISHVGPIKSVGGDQHNFVSLDVGDLSEELAAGRPIWLTGHALQLIARGGTPLGSPPVHVHHAQLRRSSHWTVSTEIQNGAAVETLRYVQNAPEKTWGGDNQCMEAEGGTDCFIAAYPFGVGTQLPPSSHGLAFDTILLDLRPDGSEAIEFYIQVGIRWTRKAQVPLRNIESFRAGRGPYNTYRISDQSASMSWGAAQAPHSGRFVHTHVHAHREFFNSMMIFAASPEQLGLAGGSGALDFSNFGPDDDVVELEKIGYSIEEAQAYLLKHLARSQRLCSLHGNCTNAPTLMCAFMDQGREPPAEGEQGPRKGAQWDRMRTDSGDCDSVFIKKGDVITQVMFHPRAENRELHWAHNLYLALFMEAGNHDAEEVAALHEFSALRHNQDRIIGPWQFATIVADGEDP
mmetsp:Transcript_38045/g.95618  ORF Transcript_38045/g.95618 Transcript_38045/m.95618 type:complete len:568 (+) Transcript_38045:952-2655(+)